MTDLIKQTIVWVDSEAQLEECCERWADKKLLAVDTEFERSSTYYPIAGLIQVNDGEQNYLIDPKEIQDWYPFVEILDDEARTIAMHACSEDLELLQIEVGTVPSNIFDTQVAVAFLGKASSQGYAKVVKDILGLDIPKSETRSDWLQRPLSEPQIRYAALDVEYLYQLAEQLIQALIDDQRLEWVSEEGHRLYKHFKALQDVNNSFKRVKSAWKLSPRKLALLKALSRWRENYAQQKNIPRNRVVKERSLLDIALQQPSHITQLRQIEGLSEGLIRKQGASIVAMVKDAASLAEDELPIPLPQPLSKEQQQRYKLLKASISELGEKLGVASEFILRKKDIEALFRLKLDEQWHEVEAYFSGWRKDVVAAPVIEALKKV